MQLALLDERAGPADGWNVRASRRARRLAVRVLPGGLVEIVVPAGTRPHAVQQFVARHRQWIERKQAQYRPLDDAAADGLPASIRFTASAETFAVRYAGTPGPLRLSVEGSILRLAGEPTRGVMLRRALQRFTMRHAHGVLAPWAAQLSGATGLRFARVQIRRQRTRWGSCSRHGTISLNACLLFQEPDVVNYLLLHELAHTRHMNHSRRFWALVERFEPRWRELDAALTLGWRSVPAWVLR
jgi:hypothetical protein